MFIVFKALFIATFILANDTKDEQWLIDYIS